MKNLHDIASEKGLDYIETTSQMNGYPSNIKGALINIYDFEDAQRIATEHNLSIELFSKRDGWNLWYRTGNTAYEPLSNSSDDYGDNYSEYPKYKDKDEFYEEHIKPLLDGFDEWDALKGFLSNMDEIWEEIEKMEDDEIVITNYGSYMETIKQKSMYHYHDTKHVVIGLIER